jgi:hypothetical protein
VAGNRNPWLALARETFGDADASPMVLISGLGAQLVAWPPARGSSGPCPP